MGPREIAVALMILNVAEGFLRLSVSEGSGSGEAVAPRVRAYFRCFETAARTPGREGIPFCPATFDGRGCWGATPAGSDALIPCPDNGTTSTGGRAHKRCSGSGTWETDPETGEDVADYSECGDDAQGAGALLRGLLLELSSLESSPYQDPRTADAFERCLRDVLDRPPKPGFSGCPRTFDGWGCWEDTDAGTTAFVPCPAFIPGFLPERSAHKECTTDGAWFRHPDTNRTWSNYTTCVDRDDLTFRQRIVNLYIAGYSTSVVALLLSLAIFFYFRCDPCTRIAIHKQLFVSFIVNNVMWILWYTEVIQRPEVILSNGVACQLLHVLVHYFLVSNYMWMFCEGLYLHTLLVVAFVSEGKLIRWFYLIGWGIPLFIIAVYTGVRISFPDSRTWCWMEESHYSWIISGPVCFSMLLNFVFLVNIVRVLVTKLRAVNSPDTHQTRKAVRATLILIPLLGLHYVVTPFRPEPRSPGEAVYETVSALVTSFQGLCVALLFCFFNGEVIGLIRKKWQQALLAHGRRMSYAATTLSHTDRSYKSAPATKSLLTQEPLASPLPVHIVNSHC